MEKPSYKINSHKKLITLVNRLVLYNDTPEYIGQQIGHVSGCPYFSGLSPFGNRTRQTKRFKKAFLTTFES